MSIMMMTTMPWWWTRPDFKHWNSPVAVIAVSLLTHTSDACYLQQSRGIMRSYVY